MIENPLANSSVLRRRLTTGNNGYAVARVGSSLQTGAVTTWQRAINNGADKRVR